MFGIPLSVEIIIRPIVGGAGTLLGPILGSFILSPLAELSRAYFRRAGWTGAHLVVYGGLLIAVVLFLPQGAYPFLARRLDRGERERERCSRCRACRSASAGSRRSATSPFGMAPGEIAGAHRPERRGEDHAFNLLSGFLRPDTGRAASPRATWSGSAPHAVCQAGLARTFQIVRPFARLSVLENVKMGASCATRGCPTRRARAGGRRAGRARGQVVAACARADPRRPEAARAGARARHRAARCSCSTR